MEAQQDLAEKGIALYLYKGAPEQILPPLAQQAALVVIDTGYLRHQRIWRRNLGARLPCRTVWVESNIIIPVEAASSKEEWSAFTLRRKITILIDDFLDRATDAIPRYSSLKKDLLPLEPGLSPLNLENLLKDPPGCCPARMAEQVITEPPGHQKALQRFSEFLTVRIDTYDSDRNNPLLNGTSRMSAALHFGFVSPLELVCLLQEQLDLHHLTACPHQGAAAYLEELIVRRELAINFCYYNDSYDGPAGLPSWAIQTLTEGNLHPRPDIYSFEQLEKAQTDDPYWNAAQNQMVRTGYMHGYMRMYWGKRLIAWTGDYERAMKFAILLNDQYSLDGRDPNGYAGIAWCFGKHDRPWKGRPIYGTVRYMNAPGLRRKFDADAYAQAYASS
jgi:deoxyribodipyrimidine photo-lyase